MSQYGYRIKALASAELQAQNTFIILTNLYQLDPTIIQSTLDIYLKSFDIKEAPILARRLSTQVPKPIIDYGNGDITYADYQEQMQMQQQQQQQQQMQMMNATPQAQWDLARAQKAQAEAIRAQAQTQEEIKKTQLAEEKLNLEVEKAVLSRFNAVTGRMHAHVTQQKAEVDASLATDQQNIDVMRDLLQHENAKLKASK